ncbi:hypothetical protein SASPL_121797 [Salvia splendens]|uniref:DUF674 family protein n=1 Tax=Salvia splendens TaxID=180675 RepID=A0A8X8XT34_SALSN|nr:uncharacterized protein LOC121742504 isoform X2 [Salvia splendens]KAG6419575.1 hypothetical protein SASPL_121797 [Salvia splendens]
MGDGKEAEFSLKVMINKEKTKVLFAQVDSHFADFLLSFLTLPLGRIIKALNKHYGDDEAPTVGSLSSLYHSLVNLDSSHFWTEGAKQTLLNPRSSIEDEYKRLKLDIADFQPPKTLYCTEHTWLNRIQSVSVYYDSINRFHTCGCGHTRIGKEDKEKTGCKAASGDGVFTINTASFVISDDLHILPVEAGLLGIILNLGITGADKAEAINVTFGFSEIMSLLKASLISQTPLSDLILNKSRHANSVIVGFEPGASINHLEDDQNPDSKKMILKVVIQKSTGTLLYAQANDDFVEFLFSFLNIPLGGVEHLLAGKTCAKAINNLYLSIADLIDDKYFSTPGTKDRLMKPNVAHGCISDNHMLPLAEECLPDTYSGTTWFSAKFPNGKGSYLKGPRTYHVTDDLIVTPLCVVSVLSSLNKQKIAIYDDVKEVELQIGPKEGLSILKASLTSTSALSDALLNNIPIKQPKPELRV